MKALFILLIIFIFNFRYIYSESSVTTTEKYTLIMSLAKKEYKMYEPVLARIELVNNDTLPMIVYSIFNEYMYEASIKLFKSGIEFSSTKKGTYGFYINVPSTIIYPKDTMFFTIPINNWGENLERYNTSSKFENVYFDQFGYFPPGEYSAYFDFSNSCMDKYGTYVRSNDVLYSVSGLTKEDEDILSLFKIGNYKEILQKYPVNPFAEHVWRWSMLHYWNKVDENTEPDYDKFINKYPDSYYLLYWRFMLPYLLSAKEKYGDFEMGLNYLIMQQNEGSFLSKALGNIPFTKIIKYYGRPDLEIK